MFRPTNYEYFELLEGPSRIGMTHGLFIYSVTNITGDFCSKDWNAYTLDIVESNITHLSGYTSRVTPLLKKLNCHNLPNFVLPEFPLLEVLIVENCPKINFYKLPYMPNLKILSITEITPDDARRVYNIKDYKNRIIERQVLCSFIDSNILPIDLIRHHLCNYL